MISLSGRLGGGPVLFHLQQLAFKSQLLPELQQTDGLASSTKCFSGAAPCLISCSAQRTSEYLLSLSPQLASSRAPGSVRTVVRTAGSTSIPA